MLHSLVCSLNTILGLMNELEDRYDWSKLNRLQLGKYAEYLCKMEFILHGCDVLASEVDDRGIDFVVRTERKVNGVDAIHHYDVQVKSYRLPGATPYVFIRKRKFPIGPGRLLALVQFDHGHPPTLFLV